MSGHNSSPLPINPANKQNKHSSCYTPHSSLASTGSFSYRLHNLNTSDDIDIRDCIVTARIMAWGLIDMLIRALDWWNLFTRATRLLAIIYTSWAFNHLICMSGKWTHFHQKYYAFRSFEMWWNVSFFWDWKSVKRPGTQTRSPASQGSSDLLSYITIHNICVTDCSVYCVYG